jgi:glycosyltransferase involved in cell wall biosynthesis
MKILHITEAYGGGVTSAINTYVGHSLQFDHYLCASIREEDLTGEEKKGLFKETFLVNRNLKSLLKLRQILIDVQPDVIHLHSTYAGFFVRLMPFVSKSKVVYTPHGYAFLRNQHPLLLKLIYAAEWVLATRTSVIAGCGRDEKNLSVAFTEKANTFELINVCGELGSIKEGLKTPEKPIITMVGRISAQKDFEFFSKVAQLVGDKATFKWIGGGEEAGHSMLVNAGVEVTGWITRKNVISELRNSSLYFHTAAWDGFPISVLEAAKLNIPMVLREIGPFSAEKLATVKDASNAAEEIRLFIKADSAVLKRAIMNTKDISKYHSKANLSNALNQLYLKFDSEL